MEFFSPNQSCYTHRHYLNSFVNFGVFSIHIYQLFVYHIFWARVAGCFHPKFRMLPPTLEKLTSPIQQMKDTLLVNLPIVSDFKNALQ